MGLKVVSSPLFCVMCQLGYLPRVHPGPPGAGAVKKKGVEGRKGRVRSVPADVLSSPVSQPQIYYLVVSVLMGMSSSARDVGVLLLVLLVRQMKRKERKTGCHLHDAPAAGRSKFLTRGLNCPVYIASGPSSSSLVSLTLCISSLNTSMKLLL